MTFDIDQPFFFDAVHGTFGRERAAIFAARPAIPRCGTFMLAPVIRAECAGQLPKQEHEHGPHIESQISLTGSATATGSAAGPVTATAS